MVYFNSQMPKYEILKKEMGEVIVASPFKGEMEKEFGSILLQNMEAQKQLSDECYRGRSGERGGACQPAT